MDNAELKIRAINITAGETSVINNINVLLQLNKNDVLNKVPFLFINSLNHIQATILLADLHLVLVCCVLEKMDQNIL